MTALVGDAVAEGGGILVVVGVSEGNGVGVFAGRLQDVRAKTKTKMQLRVLRCFIVPPGSNNKFRRIPILS